MWQKRIFHKFAQVEARKAGAPTGSGLGLAFCKLAVAAQGGNIWLEPAMQDIRHFMEYPAVQRFDHYPEYNCVWFADQRFVLRSLRSPFMFGGCETLDGQQRKILRWVDDHPEPID